MSFLGINGEFTSFVTVVVVTHKSERDGEYCFFYVKLKIIVSKSSFIRSNCIYMLFLLFKLLFENRTIAIILFSSWLK